MSRSVLDKLFWTVFGVGEAGLLYLLLAVVNSGYSWADVGGLGVLVLLGGMGAAAGVYLTSRSDGQRRWCVAAAGALLVVALGLLVMVKG